MPIVTIAKAEEFAVVNCLNVKCGFVFAIPSMHRDQLRKMGGSYYCPVCKNGQGWSEGAHAAEVKRLEAEIATAKRNAELYKQDRNRAAADAKHFQAQRDGYKGQLVKVKKRIANGVCPCCNRYFVQLHRHMTTKHKDFIEEAGGTAALDARSPQEFDAAVEKAFASLTASTRQVYGNAALRLRRTMFPEAGADGAS